MYTVRFANSAGLYPAKGFMHAMQIIKNSSTQGRVEVLKQVDGVDAVVAAFTSTGAQTFFRPAETRPSSLPPLPPTFVKPATLTPVALQP